MSKREERLQKKYPNTSCFTWHNANPRGKITTDCVVRAISKALGKDYNDVVKDLAEIQIKTGYDASEPKCYGTYLEKNGYLKMKQPRKQDNTKYTGSEFCEAIRSPLTRKDVGIISRQDDPTNIIAHLGGHHIVAICDYRVNDTWDSTSGTIGNYWIKVN